MYVPSCGEIEGVAININRPPVYYLLALYAYLYVTTTRMSTDEIEEAREATGTAPRNSNNGGGNGSSSSNSNSGGGGVPGLPQGTKGKIMLPSELSVIPPSRMIDNLPSQDDDGEEGEMDDKIGELRDKHNDSRSSGMNVICSSSSSSSSQGGTQQGRKNAVDHLTKEQYDDMCYSFSLFDINGDGKIDKEEIKHASRMFGTQKDVAEMLGNHGK